MMEAKAEREIARRNSPNFKRKIDRKYSAESKENAMDYGPNCLLLEGDLPESILHEAMSSLYDEVRQESVETSQGSDAWYQARKRRVKSSNFGKICRRRKADPSGLLKDLLYNSFDGNDATAYGKKNGAGNRKMDSSAGETSN